MLRLGYETAGEEETSGSCDLVVEDVAETCPDVVKIVLALMPVAVVLAEVVLAAVVVLLIINTKRKRWFIITCLLQFWQQILADLAAQILLFIYFH